MRVVTAFVGAAGVVAIGLLAGRLAGPRAGVIAAAVAAGYPLLWINDGMLLSESLYVPLVAVALGAAYRFRDRPDGRRALALGALLGLAALVRAEALLLVGLVPPGVLWGLRRELDGRRALALGARAVGAGVVVVAPWLAFNLTRFEHPAYMTSMTGAVLSSGSCDRTFDGDVLGYYANCFEDHVAAGGLVDGRPPCAGPAGRQPGCWEDDPDGDETVRDRYRTAYALAYNRDHLARLPVVMLARVGRTWDLYVPELGGVDEPLGQNVRLNWQLEGRGRRASELGVLLFWALLPLAAVGAVRLRREQVALAPLAAVAVVITLTAAVTIGVTRYRVPLDLVVVVLAAAGIDRLLPTRDTGETSARPDERRPAGPVQAQEGAR
jgi:4-amino-4-deoxy-L-arabinose transferase-like glycosyltransferase